MKKFFTQFQPTQIASKTKESDTKADATAVQGKPCIDLSEAIEQKKQDDIEESQFLEAAKDCLSDDKPHVEKTEILPVEPVVPALQPTTEVFFDYKTFYETKAKEYDNPVQPKPEEKQEKPIVRKVEEVKQKVQ